MSGHLKPLPEVSGRGGVDWVNFTLHHLMQSYRGHLIQDGLISHK